MSAGPWWHGGRAVSGEWLLPPRWTGICRTSDGMTDVVFITPRRDLAVTYASTCSGWIYEVEPVGEIRQDPDSMLPPGASMMCDRARIVRRFKPSRAEVARHVAAVAWATRQLGAS